MMIDATGIYLKVSGGDQGSGDPAMSGTSHHFQEAILDVSNVHSWALSHRRESSISKLLTGYQYQAVAIAAVHNSK